MPVCISNSFNNLQLGGQPCVGADQSTILYSKLPIESALRTGVSLAAASVLTSTYILLSSFCNLFSGIHFFQVEKGEREDKEERM